MPDATETKPYCYPVCPACRGGCPKAIPVHPTPKRAPYWPDSMAGKRMACGCRVDIIPTTLGIMDPVAVLCIVHGWQPIPGKGKREDRTPLAGQRSLYETETTAEDEDGKPPF